MYLVNELERLKKVAAAAGDKTLAEELSNDLAFVKEILSRLAWYADRANRSLLQRRLSGMSNQEIREALLKMRQGELWG